MSDGMAPVALDAACVSLQGAIVAGFDAHRRQITFGAADTGEGLRGRLRSARAAVEEWQAGFPARVVDVAVEAWTGWLFVVRPLERVGAVVHLAEPVGTSALRGRGRRGETDRADARWLRQLVSTPSPPAASPQDPGQRAVDRAPNGDRCLVSARVGVNSELEGRNLVGWLVRSASPKPFSLSGRYLRSGGQRGGWRWPPRQGGPAPLVGSRAVFVTFARRTRFGS